MRCAFRIAVLGFLSFRLASAAPPAVCEAIDLDQGWTQAQREEFWFTSQGSRLMPYSWFLALEIADPASQTLFRDRSILTDRYGYIWVPASQRNPDGLPIGFVKDLAESGEEREHLGVTCAACHTGSLQIGGKLVIVEGGPAMADFWSFVTGAAEALDAAVNVPAKFDRFSKAVLKSQNPAPKDVQKLRERMKAKLDDLQIRLSQNAPKNPYGFGRVDAFGHIFTRVLAQDLRVAENAFPPYGPQVMAPVSYPCLWDTPQHDVVQWNGSAPNTFLLGPLGRNVGEVLGVFGELQIEPGRKIPYLPFLTKPPKFTSSAKVTNLGALENMIRSLWSPVWPKNCLPLADAATLARGRKVYEDTCVGCHRILADPERKQADRKIKAVLKTVDRVGTDPTMAMNFVARKAKTGELEGSPNVVSLGQFGPEASGHEMLIAAVNGVLLPAILKGEGRVLDRYGMKLDVASEIAGFKSALEAARTPRYKARPLNGIWATAPYLHNGSVPTLWDMLHPPAERPQVFFLGSREFDPQKVGLVVKDAPGAFRFDTSPQGNWPKGHEFGTSLPENQKRDLLEFLKTL